MLRSYQEKKIYCEHLLNISHQLKNFVENLEDFVHLEPDYLNFERVDAKELLQEVESLLYQNLKEKQIVLVTKHLPILFGNRFLLKQLLQNLVSNALKFSHDKSEIVIFGEDHKKYTVLAVQDFGVGIKKKYQKEIFKPFLKLSSATSGSGLGLTFCKRVIKMHHGRIWCRSKKGKGSIFYFYVPKKPA